MPISAGFDSHLLRQRSNISEQKMLYVFHIQAGNSDVTGKAIAERLLSLAFCFIEFENTKAAISVE